MPFEPVFEKINYCKRKGILPDRIKVECRTDVPAESVERVLNVSAAQCMGGGTATEGKLDYGGKITFFICYRTVEGDIRKCECGAEFTGTISDASVTEGAAKLLGGGAVRDFLHILKNDLFLPATEILPEIEESFIDLKNCGAAVMTGSGSTVIGVYIKAKERNAAYKKLRAKYGVRLIKAKTL